MATTSNVTDTMDGSEQKVKDVMGKDAGMSITFTGTPTSGIDALTVKFTDGTTVSSDYIKDSMDVEV